MNCQVESGCGYYLADGFESIEVLDGPDGEHLVVRDPRPMPSYTTREPMFADIACQMKSRLRQLTHLGHVTFCAFDATI